ncbi:phosphoenolpyruvate mutase [Sporosarcina sp. P26b]|uniref:phosphoenolpyruvate mutase n=1 Tax=Sporosarcina sp. P26b TaxID=2048253 RepID=UPI000C166EB5|nr:phosphoenolpyruvate mutase [Sporosarcina sp. P26b]PIC94703.1 phosphoenolpyruvate mutase [Sporosarcina sp. P26b]
MRKTLQLKKLIQSDKLGFLMEAHNGLSAKIVENTGFKGIWASGLSIAAALGVRDNNEASWTQVLEVVEFMSDATSIPILLDGDTGYGNFNNMRRLVRKLEQRGIAGVCIEDKLFPKTNSFIDGEAQPLADMDEFCGKIKAAKDAQMDPDFMVVARVEAFIAGWGLEEALRRAEAYRLAGADAILMHSKKSNATEIKAFMDVWSDRHPVIIVPTKYYSTPSDHFREWGVSTVIWANHNVRAAITAIEEASKRIFEDESLVNVEGTVASVSHIFELQGANELKVAEKKYLPTYGQDTNAIILAASRGSKLGELTSIIPKTLLKVNGKPILHTLVDEFNQMGIKDISVVQGYGKEFITIENISTIDNPLFDETKELYSLSLAMNQIKGDTVISFGDILFKKYVLNELLNHKEDIVVIVDSDVEQKEEYMDYVQTDCSYDRKLFNQVATLEVMSTKLDGKAVDGEFIGLWKVNENGAKVIKSAIEKLTKEDSFNQLRLSDLFNYVAKHHKVSVSYIRGSWMDIDNIIDLQKAGEL